MSADHPIRAVILAQCQAWNDGDIQGFIANVSSDVVYVTTGGLVQGREALEEAYRGDWRSKPGGRLTVEVEQIMDHGSAATAVVQYWLSGSAEDRSGWSLLMFAKTEERWELVADATMRKP
jgi:uncharacterized protein (TIGR02246 family)